MPYIDYGGFGADYFEGRTATNPHPAGYSHYRRDLLPFDSYADFMANEIIADGIDPAGEKVLVAGCAYGYTVEHLIEQWDVDAYGMDVSSFAVQQAEAATAYGDRIYLGDLTSSQDIRNVRQSTPGGRFRAVFSECVLECLTDSEATSAASNAREEAQHSTYHRIWTADGSDVNPDYYNAHTLSEWQSLCDPAGDDRWYHEDEFQPSS